VANIALSLALVQRYGILGVALGTAIPQAIIYLFIYPIVFHRAMASSVSVFYRTALRSATWAVVFTLPVAYLTTRLLTPDTWPRLIGGCLLVSLAMLTGFSAVILQTDDRARIIESLKSRLGLRR